MKTKNLFERMQLAVWTDSGETYVDTGVKMLLAIVIGALLLTGIYAITRDVVLENVSSTIQGFFDQTPTLNGVGGSGNGGQQQQIITFIIRGNEYQALEGMTWKDWINSEYGDSQFECRIEGELEYANCTWGGFVYYIDADGNKCYQLSTDVINPNIEYAHNLPQ